MSCKACEQDAEKIYRSISEKTGVHYYSFKSEKGNLMYVSELALESLPEGTKVNRL